MPSFGPTSEARLRTCHPDLQRLFREVVRHWDCQVLEGHRGQEAQDRAFRTGASKIPWPEGNHNAYPSNAADVAPYPIDWGNEGDAKTRQRAIARFYAFSGFVLGMATSMGVKLRWGGDWDGDRDLWDQTFFDLVHFERLP